ncbi:MAG: hypothetical protein OXJ54_17590 [Gemmatimonadetes bacterium]|nr:hypothetical protein [Candidatus Palauibacter rhopaloidicola]
MLRNPNTPTISVMIACFTLTWLMLDGIREDLEGDIVSMEVRLGDRIAGLGVRLGVRPEDGTTGLDVRLTEELAAVESRLSADIRETGARLDRRLTRVENRLDRIIEILSTSPDTTAEKGLGQQLSAGRFRRRVEAAPAATLRAVGGELSHVASGNRTTVGNVGKVVCSSRVILGSEHSLKLEGARDRGLPSKERASW